MTPEQTEVVHQMAWLVMEQLDAQREHGYMNATVEQSNAAATEYLWTLIDTLPQKGATP